MTEIGSWWYVARLVLFVAFLWSVGTRIGDLFCMYLWNKFWDYARYIVEHRSLKGFEWSDTARTYAKCHKDEG